MLLCLACYGDRLASLAENADCFRLYRVDGGVPNKEGSINPPGREPAALSATLTSCGVQELICGGMTGCTRRCLTQAGITVHPWVKGTLDEVLNAWLLGTLSTLSMPGCGGPRCNAGGKTGNAPEQGARGQGCGQRQGCDHSQDQDRPSGHCTDESNTRPGRTRRQGGKTGDLT
ncbi:MAG: NifB/NifX family molybdenum-iron cluster-binding protein [Proteobacteria bacterium]|nr:NifB/NifX family molybdenum-iron cluster-binding protein [Pseudomonadota bacterium]